MAKRCPYCQQYTAVIVGMGGFCDLIEVECRACGEFWQIEMDDDADVAIAYGIYLDEQAARRRERSETPDDDASS